MSKTNKRRVFAEPHVFSAQEFEASGIRELSFEELLEVNGGKQVKDDPRTDKNSDTCPHSSNTPRESSSSGSGSSGGSSGGGESSGSSVSSGSLSSSGSSGSYSSESSGASNVSGGSSTSGGSNKEEERSPTQGGGAPHAEISSPSGGSSSGAESAGTNTGSSGSSSAGGSSGGGGSFDRDSPERDRDSDRDSGSWSGNYTPSGQSRESPKPNKGEKKSPTQGGGAPRGEAAATERNHGKNTGAINSGTKGGVLSGFKEFWGNAGNVLKDTTGKIRDKFEGAKETNGGKKVNNELWDTAGSYITSPTWRTGKNVEDTGIPLPTPFRHKKIDKIAERDKAALLRQEQIADSKSRRSGNVVGVYDSKIVTEKNVQKPAYFTQKLFSGEQSFSDCFANNACAATSLLNEISTEYTSLTNKVLTEKDAVRMMQAGVASGYIDEKAAWVKNWEAAANAMWAVVETRGTWSYNKKGAHTILALDRGINEITNERKFHFINNTLGNTAFDVWDMSVITDVSTLELMPYDPGYNPNGETRVLRFKL